MDIHPEEVTGPKLAQVGSAWLNMVKHRESTRSPHKPITELRHLHAFTLPLVFVLKGDYTEADGSTVMKSTLIGPSRLETDG